MVKLLYLFDILLAIVNYFSKSGRMLKSETKANLLSHNWKSNRNNIK
jgi:predicted transcriptional regulator